MIGCFQDSPRLAYQYFQLVSQADSNKDLCLLHPSSSSQHSLDLGSFEQASVGKHCCSREVARAVEEAVVVVASFLVLAVVG